MVCRPEFVVTDLSEEGVVEGAWRGGLIDVRVTPSLFFEKHAPSLLPTKPNENPHRVPKDHL